MKTNRLYLLLYVSFVCTACEPEERPDLWYNFSVQHSVLSDKDLLVADSVTGKLNYVKAFYSSQNHCSSAIPYQIPNLYHAFAIIGDYEEIVCGAQDDHCPTDTLVIKRNKAACHPAHAYILEQFKNHRVIMFDDARDRIQGRAFFLEMLPGLKKAGATHLALQGLNNRNISEHCKNYGSYVIEPVYAQIIRRAKELGFKIVSYEDTLGTTTADDHEKWQAVNLYEKINIDGNIAKTVVLAGYSHLSEDSVTEFKTMARYFAMISKTDPLTVEQINLIENSPEDGKARQLFRRLYFTDFKEPVVMDKKSMEQMQDPVTKQSYTFPYDLCVYHPATEYTLRKPGWLISKDKKLVAVKIPEDLNPVLVQAYLTSEIRSATDYDYKVPFDQAFQVYKNEVHLALGKSLSYNVVFRDEGNKILHMEMISVR